MQVLWGETPRDDLFCLSRLHGVTPGALDIRLQAQWLTFSPTDGVPQGSKRFPATDAS